MMMMATRYLARYLGHDGDDENAGHADEERQRVDGVEVPEVDGPLRETVGRELVDGETQHVFDLCGEDGEGDTAGETHDNGVGYELDDAAQAEESHHDKHGSCHGCGNGKPFEAVALYDTEYDDDECAGGASYLHRATSQGRDDEAADDGGDETFFGSDTRGDAECDGKWQRYDAHNDTGHEVGHEFFARVVAQAFQQFGLKINLHTITLKIFEAANVVLFLTKYPINGKFCKKSRRFQKKKDFARCRPVSDWCGRR